MWSLPASSVPTCRVARLFWWQGLKGYDGKTISQYVKANFNQGRLDFYNENPDRKRDASQRNVVAETQRQEQGSRKSKGASIA